MAPFAGRAAGIAKATVGLTQSEFLTTNEQFVCGGLPTLAKKHTYSGSTNYGASGAQLEEQVQSAMRGVGLDDVGEQRGSATIPTFTSVGFSSSTVDGTTLVSTNPLKTNMTAADGVTQISTKAINGKGTGFKALFKQS
jgi:hypothetical protein